MSSDLNVIEVPDDYIAPEARIFQNRMLKRKEAVQDSKQYAAFLASELKRQELEKAAKSISRPKKRTKQTKTNKKKPSRVKVTRSYRVSEDEKTSSDCTSSSDTEKSSSSTKLSSSEDLFKDTSLDKSSPIKLSSDEESSTNIDLNFNTPEKNLLSDCPEPKLSQRTKNRLKKQHNQRQKEMACFNIDDCSDIDDDLFIYDKEFDPCEEINLKIRCKGKVLQKPIKRQDNFSEVFQYISKESNAPISDILIYFNDVAVDAEDTPKKLGISTADILNCVIMTPDANNSVENQNCIEIKIQGKDSRMVMSVCKIESFQNIMQRYCDSKNLTLQKLIFEFDGDKILLDDTPVDLEMETGSVIDVKVLE